MEQKTQTLTLGLKKKWIKHNIYLLEEIKDN